MSTAATTAILRPVDQTYLDAHFNWDATVEAGMVCVRIEDYPLAAGLTPAATALLVRLPPGFPDAGPDMFWFAEPVIRADGKAIPATEVIEGHLGRSWQRWSRHIGTRWRPGVDDLRSYLTFIAACTRGAAA